MITLPDGFSLRAASNADGAAIRDLIAAVLAEYGLAFDVEKTDAGLFDIEGCYLARGGCFDVLLDAGGRIVGTVGLYRLNQDECELVKMFLTRGCRGKGLGAALMDHATERAKLFGFKTMLLTTAKVLQEAVSLYESRGFTRYHSADMPARCDTAYRLDFRTATSH
jgi:putative acetyltransferase